VYIAKYIAIYVHIYHQVLDVASAKEQLTSIVPVVVIALNV